MYVERKYRNKMSPRDFSSWEVSILQSDLWIASDKKLLTESSEALLKYRNLIEGYIKKNPQFLNSFSPIDFDENAPDIVKEMLLASEKVGTGPMSAVAGTVSKYVGLEILKHSSEVIVENGGDIFLNTSKNCILEIFAGDSPFSNKFGLNIRKNQMPIGVCTSSGKFGHSKSLGFSDAVVVISKDIALSDAAATSIANEVKIPGCVEQALNKAKSINNLEGVIIISEDKFVVFGDLEIIKLRSD